MVYRYYNLTNMTNFGNETTILSFVEGVNTELSGVPMLLMLVAIYIVLILSLVKGGFNIFKSFAASSFAMLILVLMTYPMGLVSGGTLLTFSILCPASIFLLWVWGGETV